MLKNPAVFLYMVIMKLSFLGDHKHSRKQTNIEQHLQQQEKRAAGRGTL